ncbi:MAG TPA: TadE family protein [Novosphingobium sp.]|nr:TadE family protein [Novosphingobium sp.]
MRWRQGAQALLRETAGAALVEFAMVLPVMLLAGMGLCELAYESYMQAVLAGSVDQAGRNGTIQGASSATIDASVLSAVQTINGKTAFASGYPTRKSYADFGYVAPEPFVDANLNGVHDAGECYTDVNGNNVWDADPGTTGMGGASDTVVYTVVITFPRPFPMPSLLGWSATARMSATTILKNQPYAGQNSPTLNTVCN